MKKLLTTCLLLITSFVISQAQITITVSGTVTDSATNQVIPSFPIFITVSDGNGSINFILANTDSAGFYSTSVSSQSNQIDSLTISYQACSGQAGLNTTHLATNLTTNYVYDIFTCSSPIGGGGSGGGGGSTVCDASFQALPLGSSVIFAPTGSTGIGITHDWIFGDGNSSNQASPIHVYTNSGTYNVCHIVAGPNCTDTTCQTISISTGGGTGGGGGSQFCSALFFAFPDTSINSSFLTWNFHPLDTTYTSYAWDFGDGNTSTLVNPVHTYTNPGQYRVNLEVRDTSGCFDTLSTVVHAFAPGAFCDARFNATFFGNGFSFFANNPSPNATYAWDFGDGTTSTQANPFHSYASTGNYNACLILSTATCADTFCQTIAVTTQNNGNCDAFFYATPDTNVGTGFDTWNFMPLDTNYALYFWDFGDGNSSTQTAPTHTYTTNGLYYVNLLVDDGAGCIDTFAQSVFVLGNQPNCNARFQHWTQNPFGGLTVDFAAFNSTYSSYAWDFGDGNTATTSSPTHTYTAAGTYNVCLIIDDGQGCRDTSCQSIFVTQGAPFCNALFFPAPDSNLFTWNFFPLDTSYSSYQWWFGDGNSSTAIFPTHTYTTAGAYDVCLVVSTSTCTDTFCVGITAGPPVPQCDANFTWSPNGQNLVDFGASAFATSYSWDFGDGTTGTGRNIAHTYAAAGTYNVCLIVSDGQGCQDTVCQSVSTGVIVNPGLVFGIAMTDTTPATDFTAYLITYDSVTATLTAVDTFVSTNQGGFFSLIAPTGDYLVKVALNPGDPNYASYMPTYYGDEMMWNNATTVNQGMFPFVLINMISGTNPGGPGFIGGLVSQGANKNGDNPMEGVHVLLMDMSGNAVLHATSNAEGKFSFDNIPYGTYDVIVEMWGRRHDPYRVTIDANTPAMVDLGFEVHDDEVIALGVTSIDPDVLGISGMQIAPNPASSEVSLKMNMSQMSNLEVKFWNMTGQMISQTSRDNAIGQVNWTIGLEELSDGLYFVQVIVDGQALDMQKLMIKK